MNVTIKPTLLHGDIVIPPSKSLSHRAIIAACLAKGKSVISNILFSKDILATIDSMEALGAKITKYSNYVEIEGTGKVGRNRCQIDANESGSTIRFMIPIALVNEEEMVFTGKNNLVKRPLDTYFEIFDKQGISYKRESDDYLPLRTNGSLKPGKYEIRGDISSQFITGLMFALPLLNGDSEIIITTELESKGYVDLTIDILNRFGIDIINNDYKSFLIKGNQKYISTDYTVEGDYSQSAFFLVANALGSDITLKAMNPNSLQGDKKILKDLEDLGCKIEFNGDTIKLKPTKTVGTTIDFAQSPDLGPALSCLGAASEGVTTFINASRLRIKECDRITCMREELEHLGVKATEVSDGMSIYKSNITGGVVSSHNDHRVAMALAMLATVASSEVTITNAECVSKSFPNFWDEYERLGGNITRE